jgi:transcriptional regulator NrdR family protein
MTMVKKADGRTELFVVEKIVVSAVKTGATLEYARAIAHEIEKTAKDGITTNEIKTKVLSQLKAKNPDWEKHWQVYDKAVKKRQV